MEIESLSSLRPVESLRDVTTISESKSESKQAESPEASFKELVKRAISEVNKLQDDADKLAIRLAAGDVEDVHRAMIAMQKAKLALDLTVQVRNKVIEAYQEIMRMQV
jgi:flagellar hook-basal body complex protein FliE